MNQVSHVLTLALLLAMLALAACSPLDQEPVQHYFSHVLTDGDYLNDWLTHMSPEVAEQCIAWGRLIGPVVNQYQAAASCPAPTR